MKIPVYQRQTQQPKQLGASRKSGGLPAGAFGSGNWRLLKEAGAGLQNLGKALETRKREDDNLNVENKLLALNREVRLLEYGEDGDSGYYALKGGQARGATQNLQKDFTGLKDKYGAELENPRQKEIFNLKAGRLEHSTLDSMSQSEGRQRKVWKQNTLTAKVKSNTENTLNLYRSPQLFYNSLDQTTEALRESLESNGVPKEAIDVEVHKKRSLVIGTSIIKMAKDSSELATSWYQKAKKEKDLTFEDKVAIENALEREDYLTQIQAHSDNIMLKHGDNETVALEKARGIKDSEIRKGVVNDIRNRYSENENIKYKTDFKVADTMTRKILNSMNFREAYRYAMESPETRGMRTNNIKLAMSRFGAKGGRGGRGGNPVKLQEAKVRIDKTIQGIATRKEQLSTPEQIEREYGSLLSKSELSQAVKYNSNDGNIQFITRTKLKPLYEELSGKRPRDDKDEYALFVKDITEQLEAGEKPTEDDFRKMASRFFIEGEAKGGFFSFGYGPNIQYHEAVAKGEVKSWLPLVDDVAESDVITRMERYNQRRIRAGKKPVEINERGIRRFYKRYFMQLPHNIENEEL